MHAIMELDELSETPVLQVATKQPTSDEPKKFDVQQIQLELSLSLSQVFLILFRLLYPSFGMRA